MDTSAVIKYLSQALLPAGILFIDGFINDDCTISFISEIELQVWNPANPANAIVYKSFVNRANVVGLSPGIIAETIEIRKNHKLKLPDAIIAATALQLDLTLVADNDHDFMKLPSLK